VLAMAPSDAFPHAHSASPSRRSEGTTTARGIVTWPATVPTRTREAGVTLDELRASRSAVVTVAQAAAVLGVDVRTVSRAIQNGELPALRLGRRVLIPRLPLLTVLGVAVDDDLTQRRDPRVADG
jgi:excisionase family DNA binding protein